MEDDSINLTVEAIVAKQFSANVKGYDPDEVDAYLDRIVRDYQAFERYQVSSHSYIESLEKQIREMKDKISQLELEKATLGKKAALIKSGYNVTDENIHLVDLINKYEAKLNSLGINPHKL